MGYLVFKEEYSAGKTKRFCINNLSGETIGVIKWHAPWRKYCFHTYPNTIFDTKCLSEIIDFINTEMNKRK